MHKFGANNSSHKPEPLSNYKLLVGTLPAIIRTIMNRTIKGDGYEIGGGNY
jgi:hypothetical protein